MKYPTIHIEGAILASDILDKIEQGEITGQRPSDFKIEGNYKVKDDIARAWADSKDYWRIFQRKRDALATDERKTGTSETRNQWMIPFLGILGYRAEFARAEEVNGKSYAISHRDSALDSFPIHIMGFKDELDKKRKDGGPRMSPHALVQEYLNLTEHLYAIVTNGLQIRLLRDSSRLIKLSYIEFDLERMMEEEQYADFAILYRLLHSTRMPFSQDTVAESLMEVYHQDSLESGSRIRDGLSDAVKNAILAFSNGFLAHPDNEELRNWFEAGDSEEKQKQFFQWQLRLIYRLLFLMVIEERDLIYPKNADKKRKGYYYDFYSLNKLRKLSEKRHLADASYTDYWQSVRNTFRLFENEKYGKPLGIAPLSGLFDYRQVGLLNTSTLDNRVLMECLRKLSIFKNKKNKQVMRVNYASLNVEEFGSVYEGLLEYKAVVQPKMGKLVFDLVKGSERSSSGSHYTPDELVQPLIKHSLDYIIEERLKHPEKYNQATNSSPSGGGREGALLSITVCDVACGSGHILLNAARRIATELAKVRTGEDQPTPHALRQATRDVIKHCIYGVDLNPLAVELTKVALWMEAHNPGRPLNFFDHHIKCGNAIVGLAHRDELEKGIAGEAFKTLPGDDKETAKAFLQKNRRERKERENRATQIHADFEETTVANVQEAMEEYVTFRKMPEKTPAEIKAKQKAYKKFLDGKGHSFLKTMADAQVAQFFIPKTMENKDRLMTDGMFRQILQGYKGWQLPQTAYATAVAQNKRFFHWFLEFPEIFAGNGFDCILGNPPFLGGQKLTGSFGNAFVQFIKHEYAPIASVDLVTYFFRRIFDIIKHNGFISLISTNTIAQGDARTGGLSVIIEKGGTINHAVRSMRWPGEAAVEVALVTIHKGAWKGKFILDRKEVPQITSYLDDSIPLGDPYQLKANEGKSFQGSIVLGKGFVLTPEQARQLIAKDPKNRDVLFPYLNGDDLNSRVDQSPSRWVINFFDWPLRRYTQDEWDSMPRSEKESLLKQIENDKTIEIAPPDNEYPVAADYPDCLEVVERLVKPERERWKKDKDGNDIIGVYALRKPLPQRWWHYGEKRPALYSAISGLERVLIISRVSKYLLCSKTLSYFIFADQTFVVPVDRFLKLAEIQSSIHDAWAWKTCSTMGAGLRYTASSAFETFPFLQNLSSNIEDEPEKIGKKYHEFRHQLMHSIQLGLSKTYNAFHAKAIQPELVNAALESKSKKEIEKQYGKEVWYLWNHLQKTEEACSWEEAVAGIAELRRLHKEMDELVLAAYGWHDDSAKWGPAINLAHDFYEVDYLPENDRVRYTISPAARKEVLKRLLLLNHERYEEEIKQGLHKKKEVEAFYKQKGMAVPPGITFSDSKPKTYARRKKKSQEAKEPATTYGQIALFGEAQITEKPRPATIQERAKVIIKNQQGRKFKYHLLKTIQKGSFTGEFKDIASDSKLALAMIGKKEGDEFEFGGVGYVVDRIN